MSKRTTEIAIENYEIACRNLVKLFEAKQELEFSYWCGNTGEIACFIDEYFFNIDDIIHDLQTNQPKGNILKHQDANLENQPSFINYKSWCMGLRHEQLNR